jgi:hypothetical protein
VCAVADLAGDGIRVANRLELAVLGSAGAQQEEVMRNIETVLETPLRARTIPMKPIPRDRAADYEEFKEKAWAVSQQLVGRESRRGVVSIPPLRRALAHVPDTTFNQHLLRLERNGLVYLIPPDNPNALTDDDRRDCIVHPNGDLRSFVLWMSPKARTTSFWD